MTHLLTSLNAADDGCRFVIGKINAADLMQDLHDRGKDFLRGHLGVGDDANLRFNFGVGDIADVRHQPRWQLFGR